MSQENKPLQGISGAEYVERFRQSTLVDQPNQEENRIKIGLELLTTLNNLGLSAAQLGGLVQAIGLFIGAPGSSLEIPHGITDMALEEAFLLFGLHVAIQERKGSKGLQEVTVKVLP